MRLWKRLTATLSALLMLALPATQAYAFSSPFGTLSNMTSTYSAAAGVITSPGRTSLYGGSLNMHVPNDIVHFISLSPPSFSAGCGGINMYFGGFSFISGAAFGKLVQAIMQAAPGYVIQLAIRTLCPECADILNQLQTLAQDANQMGQNSCQAAEALTNYAFNQFGIAKGLKTLGKSATQAIDGGAGSGFFSEFNGMAGSVNTGLQTIQGCLNNPSQCGNSSKNGVQAKDASSIGNKQWIALTDDGYGNTYVKEIIMSMTGITNAAGPTASVGNYGPTWSGNADPAALVQILMYGIKPATCAASMVANAAFANTSLPAVEDAAGSENDAKTYKLPTCFVGGSNGTSATQESTPETLSGSLQDCNDYIVTTANSLSNGTAPTETGGVGLNPLIYNDTSSLAGCGLVGDIGLSLSNAVNKVATGLPPSANEMAIIQMAPFPLYQLVNDASVYPGAARQLVDAYAPLLGLLMSRDMVMGWLGAANSIPQSGANKDANKDISGIALMGPKLNSLYNEINKTSKSLATSLSVQEGIEAQIKEMNQMIASQAAMSGMAGNMTFTQSIASDATTP